MQTNLTMQQAAKMALLVQDASNFSGVLNSFNEIMREVVRPECDRLGIHYAQHAIVVLFLDKLESLARCQCLCSRSMDAFSAAMRECERLAAGDPPATAVTR
jgi:hypothetical protein